jgi:hypothetical protein
MSIGGEFGLDVIFCKRALHMENNLLIWGRCQLGENLNDCLWEMRWKFCFAWAYSSSYILCHACLICIKKTPSKIWDRQYMQWYSKFIHTCIDCGGVYYIHMLVLLTSKPLWCLMLVKLVLAISNIFVIFGISKTCSLYTFIFGLYVYLEL